MPTPSLNGWAFWLPRPSHKGSCSKPASSQHYIQTKVAKLPRQDKWTPYMRNHPGIAFVWALYLKQNSSISRSSLARNFLQRQRLDVTRKKRSRRIFKLGLFLRLSFINPFCLLIAINCSLLFYTAVSVIWLALKAWHIARNIWKGISAACEMVTGGAYSLSSMNRLWMKHAGPSCHDISSQLKTFAYLNDDQKLNLKSAALLDVERLC